MVIVVQGGDVRLEDANDFTAFKVSVRGDDDSAIETVGRIEDADTAWIQIEAVRRLAGDAADQAWEEGYDAMLAYARTKGWLHDARREIQAHIERS